VTPSLSIADIARYPRPGMQALHQIRFSPVGDQVLYLFSAEGTLVQGLWSHDLESGARRLLAPGDEASGARALEEDLRRERTRTREVGVTGFQCVRTAAGALLVLVQHDDGRLFLMRDAGALTALPAAAGGIDPQLSPDGGYIAFVRDGELHVLAPEDEQARRLTDGAEDGLTNGLAEYEAQEEIGRQHGFWWSPDGDRLAFARADSRHIPRFPIVHQGEEALMVEEHRYPFAGARNAIVRLGVLPAHGGASDVAWMDLGADEDIYLARVAWRPDGTLTAMLQPRDQRSLRLVAFAPDGAATTLIEERGDPWLNLGVDPRFLRSGEILWSSEKTGFRHLYLHDGAGRELRALTGGSWVVTDVAHVDEEQRLVYFHGTADGVLERHLYVVSLDGGAPQRVTPARGWHETVLSPDCRRYVDSWSSVAQPPMVALHGMEDGEAQATLFESEGLSAEALGLCVPELVRFAARDGAELYGAIFASRETRASARPRPLVVSVYGGPHAQSVVDNWSLTTDLRAQYLAQRGYVVLKVDNRGMANRGLAFEAAVARRFGHLEVDDQVDGVRFAGDRPYVDAGRVGIYGWSYGGYMTCRALLRAPDVFQVGVAGAPVTFWEGYDTHYTERYMGRPSTDAAAYQASAVLPAVEALRGQLLLIHGLVDENVHTRHTVRLLTALIAAGKQFELAFLPEERHMVRDPARLEHLERRVLEFLERHLALPQ
jgi:dipeptidyl-peptidase-4